MPNSLVSIIVPVYNLEKYVKRCVCNLLNATYQNIEVIVIDDGSNDMSHYICDELADMDNRVKVFHIKNSGVSFARNYALESCQGEYIVFVDGDDWLDDDWLERAIQEIKIHQADIFAGGFICDYDSIYFCVVITMRGIALRIPKIKFFSFLLVIMAIFFEIKGNPVHLYIGIIVSFISAVIMDEFSFICRKS